MAWGKEIIFSYFCLLFVDSLHIRNYNVHLRRTIWKESKLVHMFRPPDSWGYSGLKDEYVPFPEYKPMPGAEGVTPPTSVPENNPLEDLPDKSEILFPHLQENPVYVRWMPIQPPYPEWEELCRPYGHWGEDEDDADTLIKNPVRRKKLAKKAVSPVAEDTSSFIGEDGTLLESALGLDGDANDVESDFDDAVDDDSVFRGIGDEEDDAGTSFISAPNAPGDYDDNEYDDDDANSGFEASDFI